MYICTYFFFNITAIIHQFISFLNNAFCCLRFGINTYIYICYNAICFSFAITTYQLQNVTAVRPLAIQQHLPIYIFTISNRRAIMTPLTPPQYGRRLAATLIHIFFQVSIIVCSMHVNMYVPFKLRLLKFSLLRAIGIYI